MSAASASTTSLTPASAAAAVANSAAAGQQSNSRAASNKALPRNRPADQQHHLGGSRSIDSSRVSSRRCSTPNLNLIAAGPIAPMSQHVPGAPADAVAAHQRRERQLETSSLVDDASDSGSYSVREGAHSLVDEPAHYAHAPRTTQTPRTYQQSRPQSKSQSRPSLTQIQPSRILTLKQQHQLPKSETAHVQQQPGPVDNNRPSKPNGNVAGTGTAARTRWTPERDEVADALLNPSFLDHLEYGTGATSNGVPRLDLEPDSHSALPSQSPPIAPHAVPLLQREALIAHEAALFSPDFVTDGPLSVRSNYSIGTFSAFSSLTSSCCAFYYYSLNHSLRVCTCVSVL